MSSAPWDKAESHEQFFVLVTGANSGVGLGAGERLIDEFFQKRSLSSHLILIPTTRSLRKSRETVESLHEHLRKVASTSKALRSRSGTSYDPQDAIRRVHVLSAELDLCNLTTVYATSRQLVHGTVGDPKDPDGPRYQIPRLDAIVLNAGFGGFIGPDWLVLFRTLFTKGLVYMCSFPDYKLAHTGLVTTHKPVHSDSPAPPPLGEVFCANVFGHYVLSHELLPLLSRSPSEKIPRGRIIWCSSNEAQAHDFNLDDLQGVKSKAPYDSSKRLTDFLALSYQLPAARKYSESYLRIPEDEDDNDEKKSVPPVVYLSHPGLVFTTLFTIWAPLMVFYRWAFFICRWLGSPWHNTNGYEGATAPVWLALEDDEALEAADAQKTKWGSSTDFWGNFYVKKTEVPWWGWEGKVEDRKSLEREAAPGVLRKLKGRRPEAGDVTTEELQCFEETGSECWREMERLRLEWEDILEVRKRKANGHE